MKVSTGGSGGLVLFTSAPSAGPVVTPTRLLEVSSSQALVVSPEPRMASCGRAVGWGTGLLGRTKARGLPALP